MLSIDKNQVMIEHYRELTLVSERMRSCWRAVCRIWRSHMKNRKGFGLDQWKVQASCDEFLWITKKNQLELYDITLHRNYIQFYASILQRPKIYRCFETCDLITTTGMLGYALRSLKKPYRIAAILLSILLWYGLSSMVFEIQIKGEKDESRKLIADTLKKMEVVPPFKSRDVSQLKTQLKKNLENDIAWLEIEKQGSRYLITYTPKEFASLSQLGHEELIAQEDGMIERFDIQHGNKLHKVNEFVHKGDVLVSNVLEDSKGGKQEVYAYVWKDITVTMDKTREPKAFQYFQLLFDARRKVSEDFHKDDRIYKENILQFSTDMGKIKMVIHYTLIKDITTP